MPLSGLRTVAKAQNGVGAFILQCKRMDFHYCDFGGSSRGMKDFIQTALPRFASKYPQIEFTVSPRPGQHPAIVGHFINGKQREVSVRKLDNRQILEKVKELRDASGEKLVRSNKPVTSTNESVRGIWSPFHGSRVKI
ncbi:hypothetical protein M011DRAFT_407461 [Sporormia fimetaria CBS 119925]|uniref:Large ribosomal subunit protein mL43 n=1 Tax=Sporormia fimetaria CBS 119925 TaxID=1340428 RepID=A0A6A6V614_9PLEO|nr:hypothetical protein M011DRAFT_407461 [Sporormia fimetaria CBS 119925]